MFYRIDIGTLLRKYGKRHAEILMKWTPSIGIYGAAAFIGICYITDWRVVVKNIPFYNGKFKEEK